MSFPPNRGYTDILGAVATAPTGAAQWLTAQIGVTGFIINWLQSGQDDYAQLLLQIDHRFGRTQPLHDIHVHYVLSSAPAAGQTVLLDYAYCWVPIGQAIPLIGAWTTATATLTFVGTEAALTHYLFEIVSVPVAPPPNQSYSSLLFLKITRNSAGGGADTYGGNFGLLYLDAHMQADRVGSFNDLGD